MKRLHVHVAVPDLDKAISFYSTLFATEPSVVKTDYAKWMLEDRRDLSTLAGAADLRALEDPAAVGGSDIEKERAFVTAFRYLKNRISLLVNLPEESLNRLALTARLQEIGRTEGSTSRNPRVA